MKDISSIVGIANLLLPREEAEIVKEFYEYNELGLAVLQTVDRLYDLDIKVDVETINQISALCADLELDPKRWEFIWELATGETSHASRTEPGSLYGDYPRAYDLVEGEMPPEACVRILQECGVSELIATRILRQKYGMDFDEAVAQVKQTKSL